jgi:hypothetical protein
MERESVCVHACVCVCVCEREREVPAHTLTPNPNPNPKVWMGEAGTYPAQQVTIPLRLVWHAHVRRLQCFGG